MRNSIGAKGGWQQCCWDVVNNIGIVILYTRQIKREKAICAFQKNILICRTKHVLRQIIPNGEVSITWGNISSAHRQLRRQRSGENAASPAPSLSFLLLSSIFSAVAIMLAIDGEEIYSGNLFLGRSACSLCPECCCEYCCLQLIGCVRWRLNVGWANNYEQVMSNNSVNLT